MSGKVDSYYERILAISDGLEAVRRELVPDVGMAPTLEGETLRAFDRVVYRCFNDGDRYTDEEEPWVMAEADEEDAEWYAEQYGDGYRTVRPSVEWLKDNAPTDEVRYGAELVMGWRFDNGEGDYEKRLLVLATALKGVDWRGRTQNQVDSRNYNE